MGISCGAVFFLNFLYCHGTLTLEPVGHVYNIDFLKHIFFLNYNTWLKTQFS